MANPGLVDAVRIKRKEAVEARLKAGFAPPGAPMGAGEHGAIGAAALDVGLTKNTMASWVRIEGEFKANGKKHFCPDWTLYTPEKPVTFAPGTHLRDALKRGGTLAEISSATGMPELHVLSEITQLRTHGLNVFERSGIYGLDKTQPPAYASGKITEYVSRKDNTFKFGVVTDNHLGSKYSRLDVLNDLYDRFEAAGVDRVYNAGNWIDGEASFNRHDLIVHGMDGQIDYLCEHYPQRKGITTYAVAGDDHEGWYAQREGVEIGRYAESRMRAVGRTDWVDLGFMEAFVALVNVKTRARVMALISHPGGGSAYALSYAVQKIIESLDGGEKPAVRIGGHYHKLWAGNIRNVWCIEGGCTQDQTPFMRKKKLEAHVGGAIVELEQDPETGAIISMTPKLMRYFNRGYYNNRWSHAGGVTHAARMP